VTAGACAWRVAALRLAIAGRADATRQQRALGDLLERGEDCTPERVVAVLRRHGGCTETELARAERRLAVLGGRFLLLDDERYPVPLRAAWPELGAPVWLFAAGGPVRLAGAPAVAIVGTRRPTLDGLRTAGMVATALVQAGAVVVSGLARGIDQAAHRAALAAGGDTIAVLGTGLGVDYPAGSSALRSQIADHGALVTELAPGTGPRPWQFLARNRIISGLAAATVVVEGGPTSGALQTARLAAGQGRDVWAVPGSINAPTSQAPLALLRDGATPLTSVDDLLDSLDLRSGSRTGGPGAAQRTALSAAAHRILDLLGPVPATTAALVTASRLPAPAAMAAIGELVEAGCGVTTPHGVVRA
jgi:DNA processing protein